MLKQILKNSIILSFGLLVGRFSGFIREILISRSFGVSADADLLLLMLTVPDLLNNLIMAGAVSGVLIPLLAKHSDDMGSLLYEFGKKLFVLALFLYAFVAIVFYYGYDWGIFSLLMVAMVSVVPNMLTFVITSVLQFEKRFAIQSLNTLVFNSVIIVAILLAAKGYLFAVAIICASIARLLWVYWDFNRAGLPQKVLTNEVNKNSCYISYRLLVVMLLANGLVFILPIIDKITASFLYESAVSTLSYAEKLYLLPVSVFLTSFAVALFPDVARLVQEKAYEGIESLLKKILFVNLGLSFAVVIGIIICGEYVSYIVFGWLGDLQYEQTQNINRILQAYLPVVMLSGSIAIILNLLFAFKVYRYIVVYSLSLLVIKCILNGVIIINDLEVIYVAYSTSLTSLMAFVLLLSIYWFKIRQQIKGARS